MPCAKHWARVGRRRRCGAVCGSPTGYLAGSRIGILYAGFRRYEGFLAIAVVVLLAAYLARRIYQHRRQAHAG